MNKSLKPAMCHKSTGLGHFPGQCLKMVIRKSNFRNYIPLKASTEAQLSGLNWLQLQVHVLRPVDLSPSITAYFAKPHCPSHYSAQDILKDRKKITLKTNSISSKILFP